MDSSPPFSADAPPFHWLDNGRYCVVVTAAGGGCSASEDVLLTGWRPDPVAGGGGMAVFARDLDTGEYWSLCGDAVPGQSVGRVQALPNGLALLRSHDGCRARIEVRLHDRFGFEQRRCELTNTGTRERRLELTSFLEVTLNHHAAHESHPAFSKLFVQTSFLGNGSILTATRRARAARERWPVLVHALLDAPVLDWTTDRASFIGRGREATTARALLEPGELGRTDGNVLDPAFSLRTVLSIAPGATGSVRFVLGAGPDRAALLRELEVLRQRAFEGAGPAGRAAPPGGSLDATRDRLVRELTRGLERRRAPRPGRARVRPDVPTGRNPEVRDELQFDNGYGGFAARGREYVVRLKAGGHAVPTLPPMPWTNVLANPGFGCVVSETGSSTTWSGNSREFRLTPWRNDPVTDPHDDALYLRDEQSGAFWSPTGGPAYAAGDVEVRHGQGCSTWRRQCDGLIVETTVSVPHEHNVRLTRVRIRNDGTEPRRLSLYAYHHWVLGGTPESTRPDLRVAHSAALQAILARNDSAPDGFADVIAFAASDRAPLAGWCVDRAAFLGVPGSTAAPAALLDGGRLDAATGEDPCAVLQVGLELAPAATDEVSFLLGTATSEDEIATTLAYLRRPGRIAATLQDVRERWHRLLDRVQVSTPSPALDLMVNHWLPYQDVACRLWGRTALYQSGGAFGFRDQLQDSAAIVTLRPDLARAQVLLHASRQFVEGDVQHWWHPPQGQGLRTRFADDLLWLPWVTSYYVAVTGDRAVLDERVGYLEARALVADEAEVLLRPTVSPVAGDLYEHCCRAIDRSLRTGAHGLPLFGCGDWNDGMNRVGHAGRGESVWMGFFLYTVLGDFLPLCALREDGARAARYHTWRERLRRALNADGWDGRWYRRGWYDDGAVLGSAQSDECRIDALVQAWAVLSGAAPAERVELALDALDAHLVDDDARLVRLLTPPFVDTPHDPGYIKGYVAGVRENGGQYTHAAVWVVRAMAEAGRRERALALLEHLLPINHALDAEAVERYRVEPYVVAADVYGAPPHVGRGGWTWYTGSAGWLYRTALETILGFRLVDGDTLLLQPRIADRWPGFDLRYAVDESTAIEIEVRNPDGRAARVVGAQFDGRDVTVEDGAVRVPLPRTGRVHRLQVWLGG
jgi:cyclic beta-1,2-glucan synthetase